MTSCFSDFCAVNTRGAAMAARAVVAMKRRREMVDEGFIGSVMATGLQAIENSATVERLVDCATLTF
jgi:hypothetical protein